MNKFKAILTDIQSKDKDEIEIVLPAKDIVQATERVISLLKSVSRFKIKSISEKKEYGKSKD